MTHVQRAKGKTSLRALVASALLAVTLVFSAGALVGCQKGGASASQGAATYPPALEESALDNTIVGSFTYDGKKIDVTARQAIEDSIGIEKAKLPDGKYAAPGADMVLAYARNYVMAKVIEQEGITVSDEEIQDYLKKSMGGATVDDLAKQYGLSKEQATKILKETVGSQKLQAKIVGQVNATEPQVPKAPAEGKEKEPTEEYAKYILGVLGNEWDTSTNTFKNPDSDYAKALADLNFDGKTATFEQAQQVYYVAYAQFTKVQGEGTKKWQEFYNSKLSGSSITINTLAS